MISLVQTMAQSSGGYVTSFTLAYTSNITAGSLLVLGLTAGNTDTLVSVVDNNGNTWNLAVTQIGNVRQSWLYYAANANAGATTITVTYTSGTYPDSSAIAREYSGIKTVSPLDVTASASDGATAVTTHSTGTTATTSQASELVIAFCGSEGNPDPVFAQKSGYGNLVEQKGFDLYTFGAMADLIVSSTGTQNGDMTTTLAERGQGVIATFLGKTNILYNAAGNSGDQAAASSYSGAAIWNGNNRCLSVDVSMLGPGVTVTAMTYGGATCTLVGVQSTVTSFGRVEQWRIIQSDPSAPAAGSNTLSITLSGSLEFSVEWVAYENVHQTSPTEGFNSAQATNAGAATDASVAVTSVADNCWIHAAVVANDTSITANQTSRNNISGTLGSGANEDNNADVTPAGATTMSYSGMSITTTWAIGGYALRPLSAVSAAAAVVTDVASSLLSGGVSTDQGGMSI